MASLSDNLTCQSECSEVKNGVIIGKFNLPVTCWSECREVKNGGIIG